MKSMCTLTGHVLARQEHSQRSGYRDILAGAIAIGAFEFAADPASTSPGARRPDRLGHTRRIPRNGRPGDRHASCKETFLRRADANAYPGRVQLLGSAFYAIAGRAGLTACVTTQAAFELGIPESLAFCGSQCRQTIKLLNDLRRSGGLAIRGFTQQNVVTWRTRSCTPGNAAQGRLGRDWRSQYWLACPGRPRRSGTGQSAAPDSRAAAR